MISQVHASGVSFSPPVEIGFNLDDALRVKARNNTTTTHNVVVSIPVGRNVKKRYRTEAADADGASGEHPPVLH